MTNHGLRKWSIPAGLLTLAALMGGCGGASAIPMLPTETPTHAGPAPVIQSVALDKDGVPRYESILMTVTLQAVFNNPYDQRQVSLDGVFKGPDGKEMKVPGYWDNVSSWRMRFTPSQEGAWSYSLTVTDANGASLPAEGSFNVTPSDLHGWLQPGNAVDPALSGHYLVYQDGTPFYGIGHCDALNILVDGYSAENGVGLFDRMKQGSENYVVWWPLYSMSPVNGSYDQYSASNDSTIDLIVQDAQKKGIFLVFTIWDNPELRGSNHSWGPGRWSNNGFSQLSSIDAFFTDPEPWAWQENLYRYIVARWGYSPAIGLWQTVSEIDGTNAYEQTDPWHKKVNDYFAAVDPYRHPTTASKSGDVDWPTGMAVMDMPQVHVFTFQNAGQDVDVVHAASVLAQWTGLMFGRENKPNWVGEFGVPGNAYYPELFHNSIWAALAAGAAMTPAEWNGGSWGEMTTDMVADSARLAAFTAGMPLAQWNPTELTIAAGDPTLKAWGVAGTQGGLFWVQDVSLEGKSITDVRKGGPIRKGAAIEITGLAGGTYTITPFDTWRGGFLKPFTVTCTAGQACQVNLPGFASDLAFKIEKAS